MICLDKFNLKCKECGKVGWILSIETATQSFPIYVNDDEELEIDGSNCKTIHSEIDHYECGYCTHIYHSQEEVLALINSV